jgi:lysophospholipase L1-like esterase
MYDFVHTNEAGARAVAERIYAELRPTLRSLAERERP